MGFANASITKKDIIDARAACAKECASPHEKQKCVRQCWKRILSKPGVHAVRNVTSTAAAATVAKKMLPVRSSASFISASLAGMMLLLVAVAV